MSNLSPTRRDLLDRLSQTRGNTRLPLDTPVEKRAALALAKKGMVTLDVERTEA